MSPQRVGTKRIMLNLAAAAAVLLALNLFAADDRPDLGVMNRVRFEGLEHSQVGKTVAYLSDVIGPRPTGSPEIDRANRWAAAKMKEWGLENVALEPYEDFGVGWAPALRLGPPARAALCPAHRHLGRVGIEHEGQDHRSAGLRRHPVQVRLPPLQGQARRPDRPLSAAQAGADPLHAGRPAARRRQPGRAPRDAGRARPSRPIPTTRAPSTTTSRTSSGPRASACSSRRAATPAASTAP